MTHTAAHDPKLLDLKRVCEAGSDRGPEFDKGIQTVIEQIENRGRFVPSAIRTAILCAAVERERSPEVDLPEAVEQCLQSHGWTLEQGVQFAEGIEYAEHVLTKYQVTRLEEDLDVADVHPVDPA